MVLVSNRLYPGSDTDGGGQLMAVLMLAYAGAAGAVVLAWPAARAGGPA
jgi:hypothetical protein